MQERTYIAIFQTATNHDLNCSYLRDYRDYSHQINGGYVYHHPHFDLMDLGMIHEELSILSWKTRQKMLIFSNQKCPILRVVLMKVL